ncbi:LpqB family beta-propeller domain-containing protein [Streptomyces sp. NPDC050504]|uniref:LpqB family beta-propeller domain-containing protein n=1 Tax=Streptomyces sp. NPDC050504 TaxID=3365618 RepID=UPI00379E4212
MASEGKARGIRLTALLGCGSVLLAGCASMPDSGGVEPVEASRPGDSQVRVYGVPPREGAQPGDIVEGFLGAMTSDDPNFATARKYLTKQASKSWKPDAGVVVLAEPPLVPSNPSEQRGPGLSTFGYALRGTQIARVDEQRAYQPKKVRYTAPRPLLLVKDKGAGGSKDGEWRIDSLPDGLLLGQSDFQRLYRSANTYYFADDRRQLVADPIYVRKRTDPSTLMDSATQTVEALLDGPSSWLRHAVNSRFPTGVALKKDTKSLELNDQNVVKVQLNEKADNVGRKACEDMAAQVLFTLRDLTLPRIEEVQLLRSEGSSLCNLSSNQASVYAADGTSAGSGGSRRYFLDEQRHLRLLDKKAKDGGVLVSGPFGEGEARLLDAAVSHDEQRAAGVSLDGTSLHVASIIDGEQLGPALLKSTGKDQKTRLSAPSWDGVDHGNLWVADRDPLRPRLLRFANGEGPPQLVKLPDLGGARIEELKVSADGVRIALLLRSEKGQQTLKLGRVQPPKTAGDKDFEVDGLRDAAPQMAEVTAMSWAGRSKLVVVGRESGGVQQVRYMQMDGSPAVAGLLPGVNQVTTIAASDNDKQPLLAHSRDDGIVELQPGGNWQQVTKSGNSPIYPG